MIGNIVLVIFLIALLLFVVGGLLMLFWGSGRSQYESFSDVLPRGADDIFGAICVVGIFVGFAAVFTAVLPYVAQVSDIEKISEHEARIDNAVERQESIETILLRELATYPEFERETYKELIETGDIDILLSIPELRSNAVVIASAEKYIGAVDTIYRERQDLERTKRDIRTRENNALVASWVLPTSER